MSVCVGDPSRHPCARRGHGRRPRSLCLTGRVTSAWGTSTRTTIGGSHTDPGTRRAQTHGNGESPGDRRCRLHRKPARDPPLPGWTWTSSSPTSSILKSTGDGRPKALPDRPSSSLSTSPTGQRGTPSSSSSGPTRSSTLAAETGTGQSLLEASRHGTVNVVGTTQTLGRPGPGPATFPSTSSCPRREPSTARASGRPTVSASTRRRGHMPTSRLAMGPPVPLREVRRPLASVAGATRTEPINVYGATKLAQEHILKAWGAASRLLGQHSAIPECLRRRPVVDESLYRRPLALRTDGPARRDAARL